jgi:hypothetical protein
MQQFGMQKYYVIHLFEIIFRQSTSDASLCSVGFITINTLQFIYIQPGHNVNGSSLN